MSMHREYKGFEVNVHVNEVPKGFAPTVTLTKHSDSNTTETQLTPPCGEGLATEDDAFLLGMDYASAAIDGEIKGIDLTSML